MPEKLPPSTFPPGHAPGDFECFGPPATRDGQFEGVHIVDMGCFTQDGKDSNKYYHAATVRSRKDGTFYAYFEWARTGVAAPQCQFVRCASQAEAQAVMAKQAHEKNDKRGQWVDVPGLGRVLQAKPGKDCYLVRSLATRVTGLPDAKTIKLNEGAKPAKEPARKKSPRSVDKYTAALLRDLGQATVAYTRTSMADASVPMQAAIDEARLVLQEALKRVAAVGDDVDLQVVDRELINLTNMIYGRIPKVKPVGAARETWILSANNILGWQSDLDAFESALYVAGDEAEIESDPYNGMNIHMEWLSPEGELGKFLHAWWPKATRNLHGNVGEVKVVNAWKVAQHDQTTSFRKCLEGIRADRVQEKCLHQPERIDLDGDGPRFAAANVNLLFHGTRSVNVPGILRERLKLPKQLVGVVINGSMFGQGAYWADDLKKSAQYTSLGSGRYSQGSGGVTGRHAFMFVADVIVGNPYLAKEAHGYTQAPSGHHAVFGKGGVTRSWGGSLMNNEWIVYDASQHQMRYLIEFAAGSGRR